jgi:drug/metabolite transporter (DMT)-like permease
MRPWIADLALVFIVAVWGWAFVAVKEATEQVPVLTFLALRFTVAALALLPLVLAGRSRPKPPETERRGSPRLAGVVLGLILAAGYVLQTFGLVEIGAGRSGVITGVGVVLVPFGAWIFLRQRVRLFEWIGVALALGGFALLGIGEGAIGRGDLLVLASAIALAAHVVALARFAPGSAVVPLAFAQVSTAAIVFAGAALIVDLPAGIPRVSGQVWGAVVMTGIVATALAFVVQTWTQRVTSPTRIALILALEPVFAMLASRFLTDEVFVATALAGAGCILAGMLCAELGPRRKTDQGSST